MKYSKVVYILLLIILSNNGSAQTIRLSGSKPYRGLHIFLMPGKSPAGERLFQFSFIKFIKQSDSIRTDSLILTTLSGRQLVLSNPGKLIGGHQQEKAKQWFSSFALNAEELSFVKNETIAEMLLLVNNKEVKIKFPDSSRTELHDVIAAHF